MRDVERLIAAVRSGDADAVEALIAARPELATHHLESGLSVLLLALFRGHWQVAVALQRRVAQPDLFEAAALGLTGQVTAWLDEEPGQADVQGPEGFTPLGLAACFGRGEVLELLLARGAAPSAPMGDGSTPAAVARAQDHQDLAERLEIAARHFG